MFRVAEMPAHPHLNLDVPEQILVVTPDAAGSTFLLILE